MHSPCTPSEWKLSLNTADKRHSPIPPPPSVSASYQPWRRLPSWHRPAQKLFRGRTRNVSVSEWFPQKNAVKLGKSQLCVCIHPFYSKFLNVTGQQASSALCEPNPHECYNRVTFMNVIMDCNWDLLQCTDGRVDWNSPKTVEPGKEETELGHNREQEFRPWPLAYWTLGNHNRPSSVWTIWGLNSGAKRCVRLDWWVRRVRQVEQLVLIVAEQTGTGVLQIWGNTHHRYYIITLLWYSQTRTQSLPF